MPHDAKNDTFTVTVTDVYSKLPMIPDGWIQGPFQIEQPDGHFHWLGVHGVVYAHAPHLGEHFIDEPRIWLKKQEASDERIV